MKIKLILPVLLLLVGTLYAQVPPPFIIPPSAGGSGDVTGPASVTADGNVAVFSGTGGKTLKDGGAAPWSTGSDGTYGVSVKDNTATIAVASGYASVFGSVANAPVFRYGAGTVLSLIYSGGALGTPSGGSAANLTEVRTGAKGSSGLTANKAYFRTNATTWTQASTSTPQQAHCFAISSSECISHGKYAWASHSLGNGTLYLSTTGDLTTTAPTTSAYIIQIMGYVYDTGVIIIDVSPNYDTIL